jgi:hypothetical protein
MPMALQASMDCSVTANPLRRSEARRIIDGCTEGERHDRTNPRHNHQTETNRIVLGKLVYLFFKGCTLLSQGGSGPQQ